MRFLSDKTSKMFSQDIMICWWWYEIGICSASLSRNWWYRSVDGIPWWSSRQVLATNYCECSVSVCVLLVGIYYRGPHLATRTFLPAITVDTKSYCKFPQCHIDHSTSLCASDGIDSRNKCLKYLAEGGAQTRHHQRCRRVLQPCKRSLWTENTMAI
jgi:hypothetical protein